MHHSYRRMLMAEVYGPEYSGRDVPDDPLAKDAANYIRRLRAKIDKVERERDEALALGPTPARSRSSALNVVFIGGTRDGETIWVVRDDPVLELVERQNPPRLHSAAAPEKLRLETYRKHTIHWHDADASVIYAIDGLSAKAAFDRVLEIYVLERLRDLSRTARPESAETPSAR